MGSLRPKPLPLFSIHCRTNWMRQHLRLVAGSALGVLNSSTSETTAPSPKYGQKRSFEPSDTHLPNKANPALASNPTTGAETRKQANRRSRGAASARREA